MLAAFGIVYAIYNEPLPEAQPSAEADMLANKMLKALNYDAYKETRYLEWSFRSGAHKYKWDKTMGKVQVSWSDTKVALNLSHPEKSTVWKNNTEVIGNDQEKSIRKAVSLFNNDSFWLVAPFKVFDKGTTRSIVPMEDGSRGLLVHYSEGGDTPNDSYLWKLADSGFPESYQMWTKIIPIGGVEASWDDWQVMESGAFLPKSHQLGPVTLSMGEPKGY